MILTSGLLHEVSTNGDSGWNREQLEFLGVAWPPKRGWISELVGKEIEEEKWAMVDRLRGVRRKKDRQTIIEYYKPFLA